MRNLHYFGIWQYEWFEAKNSYEHGSDFKRLQIYDRLNLGIEVNGYWQWTEENNKPAQYMIHLKYKCKVNFTKLPLIWIELCLKLVFENVTAGRNTGCRLVVNCASCSLQLPLTHSDAVCGVQNATKQCISRYHLHTGLCYWSTMDKTLDHRRLSHLITNFQRCRHQPQ